MPLKVARNRNIFIPNENAGNSSNCSFTCLKGTVISSTHTSHVLPVKNSGKAPNAGSQAFAPRRDAGQPLGRVSRPPAPQSWRRHSLPRRAQSVLSPVPPFLRLATRRSSSAQKAGSGRRPLGTKSPPHAFARRHLFAKRTATCTCKAGACWHQLLERPAYLSARG